MSWKTHLFGKPAPCMTCDHRTVGCHTDAYGCQEWNEWQREIEEYKKRRNDQQKRDRSDAAKERYRHA